MNEENTYPIFLIGLTGSMGCGKSFVGDLFSTLGAWMIDTDQVARHVVAPGSAGLRAVIDHFGISFLEETEHGSPGLDRKKMAAWIFSHPEDRIVLEQMLHSRILLTIRDTLLQAITPLPEGNTRIAILEVPLLFEAGWDRLCDLTINVACGPQQWPRLAARDNMSEQVKHQVMARQLDEEEKNRRAHRIIDNRGSKESTLAQVQSLWSECLLLAHNHRRPLWTDVP
ncbi:MAG: dephospho-CoA kinase [Magnetococcales bacterium]|nr:dephospho-CoA kinase [Magnetococcales bacterium]MBF0151151.1 dephospho-CoA kinase [Magnetococcales bacterium]